MFKNPDHPGYRKELQASGKSLGDFGLPQLHEGERAQILQLLGDELPHNGLLEQELLNNEEALHDRAPIALQPSQRQLYDISLAAVTQNEGVAIFVDAPGGYGKTYVENAILSGVRTLQDLPNSIALAVATSGIASTLLKGGRTFHSKFKAPLHPTEKSTLNIAAQSEDAILIRQARIIIWNEAPMAHRYLLEVLDRTLQDITGTPLPFVNKVIVLAGHFGKSYQLFSMEAKRKLSMLQAENFATVGQFCYPTITRKYASTTRRLRGNASLCRVTSSIGQWLN